MIMSPLLEILSPSMQNLGGPLKLLLPSFLPSFLLLELAMAPTVHMKLGPHPRQKPT